MIAKVRHIWLRVVQAAYSIDPRQITLSVAIVQESARRAIPNRLGFWYREFMPTVLRVDGLRIVVYPNDHRPAHVHVIGNGCEAVFRLNEPNGPPELRENFGFSVKEIGRIKSRLDANLGFLCDEWRRIHGEA